MIKLLLLSSIFILGFTGNVIAQDEIPFFCAIPDFESQAAIDNFATNYPGCTRVSRITISGSDITNLDGLSGIRSLAYGGINFINCPLLNDIKGLSNITGSIAALGL